MTGIGEVNYWVVSIREGQPNGDHGRSRATWSSRDEPFFFLETTILGRRKSIPFQLPHTRDTEVRTWYHQVKKMEYHWSAR